MNRVRARASNTWEHMEIGLRGRRGRPPSEAEAPDVPEDDDDSRLALFFWGMLTALTLWWLYLRPVTTERRLNQLRASPRPGPRPGSRPASNRPPQYREREPAITPAAEETEPAEDDLTLIWGIGPARATRLQEAGIGSFAALAVADAEQLRDILAGVGVGVGNADISSWPEQASLAARGDWEGLEAYKEQLRAERG